MSQRWITEAIVTHNVGSDILVAAQRIVPGVTVRCWGGRQRCRISACEPVVLNGLGRPAASFYWESVNVHRSGHQRTDNVTEPSPN